MPLTVKKFCSHGWPASMASTCITASSVRLVEAASGSWISAMKDDWSSSGRKPVGTTRSSPPVASANRATSPTASTLRRISGAASRR